MVSVAISIYSSFRGTHAQTIGLSFAGTSLSIDCQKVKPLTDKYWPKRARSNKQDPLCWIVSPILSYIGSRLAHLVDSLCSMPASVASAGKHARMMMTQAKPRLTGMLLGASFSRIK